MPLTSSLIGGHYQRAIVSKYPAWVEQLRLKQWQHLKSNHLRAFCKDNKKTINNNVTWFWLMNIFGKNDTSKYGIKTIKFYFTFVIIGNILL